MKTFVLPSIIAGIALLGFSFLALMGVIYLLPILADEFYNPIFNDKAGYRTVLFFLHPFVISFALAWFWSRFKGLFHGSWITRGFELGFVYALVATLPSMWVIFSALTVSLPMVLSWLLYGFLQATICGLIYARMAP